MMYCQRTIVAMIFLSAIALLAGCNSDQQPGAKEKSAQTPAASAASAAADDEKEIAKALAELSPAERAAAEKQRVCPVSGERLGSMGKPYKVTVKGQTLFLCCSGCEDELKQEPDKYLAKLKK